jgi:uncharacterized protein (DUF779 family)
MSPASSVAATAEHGRTRPARLTVTSRARRELARSRTERGPIALLLSWPSGAVCLPAKLFSPSAFDVIVGHVSGCPILADVRQLAFYRDRRAVLDVQRRQRGGPPVARLRPVPAEAPGS